MKLRRELENATEEILREYEEIRRASWEEGLYFFKALYSKLT